MTELDYNDRSWWEPLQVDLPEGETENWKLEHFEITEEEADHYNTGVAMRAQVMDFLCQQATGYTCRVDRIQGRGVVPGKYTRLVKKDEEGTIFMSDTPAEIAGHYNFIRRAKGNVLITGLGIGMVAEALLKKEDIGGVTVVEIDPEVISLVGPTLTARYPKRLEIICADAFKWRPGKQVLWAWAWHDIWPNIGSDNVLEMRKLKRKYASRVLYQFCWAEDECAAIRRDEMELDRRMKKLKAEREANRGNEAVLPKT